MLSDLIRRLQQATDAAGSTKIITIYPTYGYRAQPGDHWTVPMRIGVHKDRLGRLIPDQLVNALFDDHTGKRSVNDDIDRCKERLAHFLADDDTNETVTVQFEGVDQVFRFASRTNRDGLIEAEFKLPHREPGWVKVSAIVEGTNFTSVGAIHLLENNGKSVISDIDDTIKVTQIPAGAPTVLLNTFLREYVAADSLQVLYGTFENTAFHYVSGGPWQMFRVLKEFLIDQAQFPSGTFHMRKVTVDPLDLSGVINMIQHGLMETFDHKLKVISALIERLPGRRYTLVGDSGECDPEVYSALLAKFPKQIERIIIRDIVMPDPSKPRRLNGMDLLPIDPKFPHDRPRCKGKTPML